MPSDAGADRASKRRKTWSPVDSRQVPSSGREVTNAGSYMYSYGSCGCSSTYWKSLLRNRNSPISAGSPFSSTSTDMKMSTSKLTWVSPLTSSNGISFLSSESEHCPVGSS